MNYKKILLAVDASENAKRAAEYVAEIIGASPEFEITLLYVVRYSEMDIFPDEESWRKKIDQEKHSAYSLLDDIRELIVHKGVRNEIVSQEVLGISSFSIAQAIMDFQRKGKFGTIVVGRRGMSKAEEFLFGSISNKIVHYAKGCAVWVIE